MRLTSPTMITTVPTVAGSVEPKTMRTLPTATAVATHP